jgi:hypothetical protein
MLAAQQHASGLRELGHCACYNAANPSAVIYAARGCRVCWAMLGLMNCVVEAVCSFAIRYSVDHVDCKPWLAAQQAVRNEVMYMPVLQ